MASTTQVEVSAGQDYVEHCNEVRIVGRVSMEAVGHELPSGDCLVKWRLVVDRPDNVPGTFDVVECATFNGRVRRQALAWRPGDVVEVYGALRRRFWGPTIARQSRYEVHVDRAARLWTVPVKRRRKPG
jgi:single-strand DNA-binding protein